ncbi:MAG: Bifunctional protein folD [uncultured bacterium]|nr:MAG: Bifunctional protein folD [uncultured bacterium]
MRIPSPRNYGDFSIHMTTLVQGHTIAKAIYQRLQKEIPTLQRRGVTPKLAVVLVGNNKPSLTYVRKKGEAAAHIGVDFVLIHLPANTTTQGLLNELRSLQQPYNKLTGLIVQLPLPRHINTGKVLEAVLSRLDVDCLTQTNLGKLITGSYWIEPPTPGAIISILKYHKVPLVGVNVVVIGAGALVGRPLVNMLMYEQATVSILNQATRNLSAFTKNADIIITGVGKPGLLTGSMVKPGVVVVDAGVSFIGKKISGDIDFPSVAKKAKLVTPTPGGVGPLTVAKLIENTVKCAKKILTQ